MPVPKVEIRRPGTRTRTEFPDFVGWDFNASVDGYAGIVHVTTSSDMSEEAAAAYAKTHLETNPGDLRGITSTGPDRPIRFQSPDGT